MRDEAVQLAEAPLVEQEIEPLPSRELPGLVLPPDPLLAAADPRPYAAAISPARTAASAARLASVLDEPRNL